MSNNRMSQSELDNRRQQTNYVSGRVGIGAINLESIRDKSMPLSRVITLLEEFGFRLIHRANRASVGAFTCPEWYMIQTGSGELKMDIRTLALWAYQEWDRYVNPNIESMPISEQTKLDYGMIQSQTIEDATIEPEDIRPSVSQRDRDDLNRLAHLESEARSHPNKPVRIRSGYYFYFSTLYNALLEIEKMDYSDFSHSREWIARDARTNEGIAYRASLRAHLDELTPDHFSGRIASEMELTPISPTINSDTLRADQSGVLYLDRLGIIIGHYFSESEARRDFAYQTGATDEPNDPAFSDYGRIESEPEPEPEPTEDESPIIAAPDEPEIDSLEQSILALLDHRAELVLALDNATDEWTKNTMRECIESCDYALNLVDRRPLANLANLALSAFNPMAIGAITCLVKVINVKGKFEILESSSGSDIPIGKRADSTVIAQKPLGTEWAITCHLTDKGSIKIDSITEPESASIPSVASSSMPAPIASSVAPLSASGVTTVQTPEPVNRVLSSDIDKWECPDYYISPDAREAFKRAYALLAKYTGSSVKILMTGESGYGKTTIAEKFASFVGFDCYRMNCATIRDTEEWFFDREVKTVITNGVPSPETVFTPSEFSQRIARGNVVIILDEFNRLESNLHNSLFPLLDDSGKTSIHHIDFSVGQNVIFVATVNLGAAFVGTFLLDEALTNRFDMILEVKPMPFDHECAILRARFGATDEDAELIVKLATILRENNFVCSTRDTLKIAKLCSVGMSIRDGFEYVVIRRIPEDESNAPLRKSLVDLVNKSIGVRGQEFTFSS